MLLKDGREIVVDLQADADFFDLRFFPTHADSPSRGYERVNFTLHAIAGQRSSRFIVAVLQPSP